MFDAGSNQSLATQLLAPVVGGLAESGGFDRDIAPDELPCRLVDPELFFAEQPADVEYAKSLCRDCPVQAACLSGALERHEPWGVWGGQLLISGEVVARKRPRGRPRKNPQPDPEPVAAVRHRWVREEPTRRGRVRSGAERAA
jgi:WhiB family transcriptional regulator, redox-sensing transcriptional regulator